MNIRNSLLCLLEVTIVVLVAYALYALFNFVMEERYADVLNIPFWRSGAYGSLSKLAIVVAAIIIHRRSGSSMSIYLLLSLVLIVYHFHRIVHFAENVPVHDDYHSLLGFVLDPSAEALVEPWVGSRVISIRLIGLVMVKVTGVIDFIALIFLVNVFLIGILFLMRRSNEMLFVLTLLFCHLGYYDVTLWASSMVNTLVVLCVLLVIAFSSQGKLIPALIFATIAVCTFGNGFFAFPIALMIFGSRKEYGELLTCAAFGVLMVLLFSGREHAMPLHSPLEYLYFSALFLGSAVQFGYTAEGPLITGISILCVIAGLLIRRYDRINRPNFMFMLFLLFSSLAAAHYRIPWGPGAALSNRYIFYSLLMVACLAIALVDVSSEEKGFARSPFHWFRGGL